MKLTLIRTARETGKETFSTWPSGTLMEKMKTENKAGHISALRSLIPHITGSNGHYPCIDKLPRICPAAEYARSKEGERYLKTYNGLVQIEVNHLANAVEVEQVKRQAALLPQTFAAFCGSSGRSVKIWVLFATPDGSRPRQRLYDGRHRADAQRGPRGESRRFAPQAGRKNQAVSYRCLPARRKLLPAPAPLPRHTERTCRGAKLPHDAR